MMYKIKHKIKRFNYEQTGLIELTDRIGNLLEFTSVHGRSYIVKSRFEKLIKTKKIKEL